MNWWHAALAALLAGVTTLMLVPVAIRIAKRTLALDQPGGRKQHTGAMPRLGGIAIVGGIVLALGPGLLLVTGARFSSLTPGDLAWFGLAVALIFAVGLLDDIRGLAPLPKLVVQIAAAAIVVSIGWQFDALRLPLAGRLNPGEAGAVILSIFWVVGVTNAINFIDGLDGLAAGVVAIIASSLLVLAGLQRDPEMIVVAAAIIGSCVAFLRHNWRPARIYMGDSGSLTLGFVLASISLQSSMKASAAVAILVPMLALGLPVIDTLLVMWYRFLRGHPTLNRVAGIFAGDRNHLHHLLLDSDVDRGRVMLTLYGLAAGFCAMALVVAISRSFLLGVAFLVVEVLVVLLVRRAGLSSEARRLAASRLERLHQQEDGVPPLAEETTSAVSSQTVDPAES